MVTHEQLKIGQVVYFIMNDGYNYQKRIHFGIVDDMFSDAVSIKMYTQKEIRLIDGVPYNDFKTPTHWQKLPKNWTYKTELIHLSYDNNIPEDVKKYCNVDNPDDILKLIERGWLIPNENKDWSHIETEIDSKFGWRAVRKFDGYTYHPSYVSYHYFDIYASYEEALKYIRDYEAELNRQSELTDVEWSLELIENNVSRYVTYNYTDEEVELDKKNKIMDWFKTLKSIEDVETRLFGSSIQWKYWKNKKWLDIDENLL